MSRSSSLPARPGITQRPNPYCPFFSLYRVPPRAEPSVRASEPGFGAPDKTIFVFTGDGCLCLFAGNLAEARDLRLNLFVLNNGIYGSDWSKPRKTLEIGLPAAD